MAVLLEPSFQEGKGSLLVATSLAFDAESAVVFSVVSVPQEVYSMPAHSMSAKAKLYLIDYRMYLLFQGSVASKKSIRCNKTTQYLDSFK